MRRTASSERAGVAVDDRWGGRWVVRCTRAGVLPAPAADPHGDAVGRLLLPWGAPSATVPPRAAPTASWVLGRSARWHGPDAPGAGEEPLLEEALRLRNVTGLAGTDLAALALPLWGWRVRRAAQRQRTHPWLVHLCCVAGPGRWATWAVVGPDAAQVAVTAVADAVLAGRVPDLPAARLLDVRDDRR